ncbi:hypothetical protein Zmor_017326 [Zophobas morio]|uniref:Uncharacterized protein n=1 Tax=Zophobas morio TaxID=2755281 RepID=A0AA38MCQ4_9CUCU|nr:hypothetical protein Zmor_017326 [Zophobas morio]
MMDVVPQTHLPHIHRPFPFSLISESGSLRRFYCERGGLRRSDRLGAERPKRRPEKMGTFTRCVEGMGDNDVVKRRRCLKSSRVMNGGHVCYFVASARGRHWKKSEGVGDVETYSLNLKK